MAKIHGIQHIGVAVSDMNKTLPLYRKWFGMNIPFFDSVQAAPLMQVFTRNQVITKRASMVMNLKGGCAMEVIEPTSFKAQPLPTDFTLGDIGIFAVHMRMQEPEKALAQIPVANRRCEPLQDPIQQARFLIQDPDGLYFWAKQDTQVFSKDSSQLGGVAGLSLAFRMSLLPRRFMLCWVLIKYYTRAGVYSQIYKVSLVVPKKYSASF
jgi:catechol 2,3-dioxygenase-like lactoylglutathione lyase family enzyme